MPFRNYVCWNKELIRTVMDPDALQTPDHFFLATHHPAQMHRVSRRHAATGELVNETQLLTEFMDPSAKHVFAVVLGATGSGKSHLVRWLSINIPRTEKHHVVLIPKSGTNLRGVIDRLLAGMQGPQFDEYRRALLTATSDLTPNLARKELRAQLSIAVSPDGPHAPEQLSGTKEREQRQFLMDYLPALLDDAEFGGVLLRDEGIVDRLTRHMFGDLGRERIDKRREFNLDDFDTDKWGCDPRLLGDKARTMYLMLKRNQDNYRETVVNWLNRNLDYAIRRVLKFGDESLGNLMIDIRETLGSQKKELILLIEDFYKLQGIDSQLLEALLVRQEQVGRRLCVLRSAIATTDYSAWPDTVHERITLAVDLNVETGAQAPDRQSDILAEFSSRYLNAVRLEQKEMVNWHLTAWQPLAGQDLAPPSACGACDYLEECHSVFGVVANVGLYPFTRQALSIMYSKVAKDPRLFNPRDVIKLVLSDPLSQYGEDLRNGVFPPKAMLSRFGKPRMPVWVKSDLEAMVEAERREQYRTLFELWGDPLNLTGIDPGIFQAFGLRPLDTEKRTTPVRDTAVHPEPAVSPPKEVKVPPELQRNLTAIDEWANGGHLPQKLAGELRNKLAEALIAFTDWDSEMLLKTFYVGGGRAFSAASIDFTRQSTGGGGKKAQVHLELPFAGDFTNGALALQCLILYEHHRNWAFERGDLHLRALANCLSAASAEVVRQLRQLEMESSRWDPVPSAVELLAIGAQMQGNPTPSHQTEEDFINALFLRWDEVKGVEDSPRSRSWQDLIKSYARFGGKIADILKARTVCTKGGVSTAQIIDAAAIVPSLNRVRRSWQPSDSIPETIRNDYKDVQRLRGKVDELLTKALDEETRRYLEWYERISQNLPLDESRKETIEEAKKLVEAAREVAGLPQGLDKEKWRQTVDSFENSRFDNVVKGMERLRNTTAVSELLPILGRSDYAVPMAAADTFVSVVDQILTHVSKRVGADLANLGGEAKNIQEIQGNIGKHLRNLCEMMNTIWGGSGDDPGTIH